MHRRSSIQSQIIALLCGWYNSSFSKPFSHTPWQHANNVPGPLLHWMSERNSVIAGVVNRFHEPLKKLQLIIIRGINKEICVICLMSFWEWESWTKWKWDTHIWRAHFNLFLLFFYSAVMFGLFEMKRWNMIMSDNWSKSSHDRKKT